MDNINGFEQRFIRTRHGRLSVLVRGGQGPALICLHGNSFSGRIFADLVNDAAFRCMPIIIADLPGHGLSDNAVVPMQTYSYASFGDCIIELAAALNLTSYVVFGWSLGGQIAIDMLDRSPGLIGVATCGSAAVQRGPLGLINGFHISRDLLLAGKANFKMTEAHHFAEICTGKVQAANHVSDLMRADPALRPSLSKASLFGQGRDQRAAIAETTTPVLLMLGEDDPFIRADNFAKTKGAMLFGGRPQILAGSGHAPFIDNQTGFARRLVQFYHHSVDTDQRPKLVSDQLQLAS